MIKALVVGLLASAGLVPAASAQQGTLREAMGERATSGDVARLGEHFEERLDAAGVVRARVPHGPGRLGVVGAWLVTVAPSGEVRTSSRATGAAVCLHPTPTSPLSTATHNTRFTATSSTDGPAP